MTEMIQQLTGFTGTIPEKVIIALIAILIFLGVKKGLVLLGWWNWYKWTEVPPELLEAVKPPKRTHVYLGRFYLFVPILLLFTSGLVSLGRDDLSLSPSGLQLLSAAGAWWAGWSILVYVYPVVSIRWQRMVRDKVCLVGCPLLLIGPHIAIAFCAGAIAASWVIRRIDNVREMVLYSDEDYRNEDFPWLDCSSSDLRTFNIDKF